MAKNKARPVRGQAAKPQSGGSADATSNQTDAKGAPDDSAGVLAAEQDTPPASLTPLSSGVIAAPPATEGVEEAREAAAVTGGFLQADREKPLKNYDELSLRYEKPVTQKAKKRKALKVVLLLLMFGISFYLLFGITDDLSGSEGIGFAELAAKTDLWLLAALLAAVLAVIIFLQTAKFTYINKVTTGSFMLRTAAKINLLGKYYDNLTPSQTGGQPFQMYYMAKRGVKTGYATAIPTINYIIQMYAWQLVTLVLLIINGGYIYEVATAATTITVLCWVGWSLNMFPPLLILLLTFSPRTAKRIARALLRLGYKMKIIKNYKKALKKTYGVLDDYCHALAIMAGKVKHVLGIALVSTVEYLTMLSIPLLIGHFIGGVELTPHNWMNMATLYIFSSYSVTFMPTPGAAGFAEVSTSLAFSGIDGGVTKWMVLLLRLVIYYSYIFIGFIIIAYDFIKSAVKGRREKRLKRQTALEADEKDRENGG